MNFKTISKRSARNGKLIVCRPLRVFVLDTLHHVFRQNAIIVHLFSNCRKILYTPLSVSQYRRKIFIKFSGLHEIYFFHAYYLQVLTHYSIQGAFGIYIGLSLIGGVCCLLLPIETKGKGLEAINEEVRRLDPDYKEQEVLLDHADDDKREGQGEFSASVPCCTKLQ